ncbi:hypothetical protein LSPH24S_03432 [Lysinibacillus sphaericus]
MYPEWLTIFSITNDSGEITNYCGIFSDLSERKIVENELEKRLLTDSLTDVSNRFAYIEKMDSFWNRLLLFLISTACCLFTWI